MRFKRLLDLSPLLKRKGLFLLGPRQTGKTDYLLTSYPEAEYIDLLKNENYSTYLQKPELFRKKIELLLKQNSKRLIIVDEIQRLPLLLNEIHSLIEAHKGVRFILTGSSCRKLKSRGVNLLGGRVTSQTFFPLTFKELGEKFRLDRSLLFGNLPQITNSSSPYDDLQDYVGLYLKEEIAAEALVRNLTAFSEVLKLCAISNSEVISFSSFANDVQLSNPTIKEYFNILEDTLIGHLVAPFNRTIKRKVISSSKFYFFDTGVVSALLKRKELSEGTSEYGKQLEQYIFQELKAYIGLERPEFEINFWRTKSQDEIDFIVHEGGKNICAIEVKSSKSPRLLDLKAFKKFEEELPIKRKICVSLAPSSYLEGEIEITTVNDFLTHLWNGKYF